MNQKTVKKYASLKYAKYREEHGLFLAEGNHVVDSLITSEYEIESIITSDKKTIESLKKNDRNVDIEFVGRQVIDRIATTSTPQEVLAVVRIPEIRGFEPATLHRIVVADGIKDPGNMGTIIRTAAAFGFEMVITTTDSVDIYNPKVVRSTQGALFQIKTVPGLKSEFFLRELKASHTIYSLSARGDSEIDRVKPAGKSTLVIGSEIDGVSETILENSDFRLKIPQRGVVDSLNAAVAAGIVMFIFSRKSKLDLS